MWSPSLAAVLEAMSWPLWARLIGPRCTIQPKEQPIRGSYAVRLPCQQAALLYVLFSSAEVQLLRSISRQKPCLRIYQHMRPQAMLCLFEHQQKLLALDSLVCLIRAFLDHINGVKYILQKS